MPNKRGKKMNDPWNRCDVCGKFIAMEDFDKGAVRHMATPDSDRSCEEWETLCIKHGAEDRAAIIADQHGEK